MDWSHIHVWWIKIREGHLRSEESQPHTRPPSSRFQCQEGKSPQLLSAKPSRHWFGGRKFWSTKQFLLNIMHMDLLRLTPSELQHWGSSLKGTSDIGGGTEVSGVKVRAGGQLSPRQKGGQRPLSLSWMPPYKTTEPAGGCYLWDSIKLAKTVCPALEMPWGSAAPNIWVHISC